jgi:hypothetical protein
MIRVNAVAIILVLAATLQAGTIRVPSDQPNIQLAVDAAAAGDTVLLEASGSPFVGVGNRDLTIAGKAIVLRSEAGSESVVLDAQGAAGEYHRLLTLSNVAGSGLRVEGITFAGGMASLGGGVSISASKVTFSECVFSGNAATSGGALGIRGASWVKAERCAFRNCSADTGGAIYCATSEVWLVQCRFDSNRTSSSGSGGAICGDSGSTVWADSCILAENSAGMRGGAATLNNSDAWFSNCTLVGNSAQFGQHLEFDGSSPRRELSNCIIAWGIGGSRSVRGTGILVSCCNVYGNQEGDWVGVLAPFADTLGNMQQPPLFSDRHRGVYSLLQDSPCLPANNSCGELIGAQGLGREGGLRVWHCTPEGTSGIPTIQAALDSAILGDTVRLGPGTYGGVGNRNLVFYGKSIALVSDSGPERTIIDCTPATADQESRGFLFVYGEDSNATVSGVTIVNGSASTGGGVCVRGESSPRICGCTIRDNVADSGGGLYIDGGQTVFEYCTIDHNTARCGGAVYLDSRTDVVFRNCTIVSNTGLDSSGTHGSALDGKWYAQPVIENCIIAYHGPQPVLAIKGCSDLQVACTDIYGNSGGDWTGCLAGLDGVNGNLSVDPLFADTTSADYHLRSGSPCLAGNNTCGVTIGAGQQVSPQPTPTSVPTDYVLRQNYPNPFNAGTTITYALAGPVHVELEIFNTLGQRVRTLIDGTLPAREHTAFWDGCDDNGNSVSTGVYLYRLTAGDWTLTRKMMLLK